MAKTKAKRKTSRSKAEKRVPEEKEGRLNYVTIVLLVLFLVWGLNLRLYHIDYPVIGYHNWKETHYLTEARNFAEKGFFRYGFFIPVKDYPSIDAHPSGVHADTFPTISIAAALGFMLFGQELWVARLIGTLFNLGTVVVMYLFVKKLFNREDLAILCAFLTALLPLFVFYSHNVQLINIALFFMVSSAYFYLRWRADYRGNDLIFASLFLMLATVTKYSFGIILAPMLLTFPYGKLREWRKIKRELVAAFLIFLLFPLWHIYANYLIPEEYRFEKQARLSQIKPEKVFELKWDIIESYIIDNYTMLGLYIAILGLLFVSYAFYRKRNFAEGFTLAYALSIIPFGVLMASKLSGHNYHQYPLAPLIVVLIAYFIIKIGDFAGKLQIEGKKIKHINVLVVVLLSLIFPMINQKSIDDQFNMQFPGLDLAGDYIREHSEGNERMFFSGHQTYGVLWHSGLKGYPNRIPTPELFEQAENKSLNISWIFIYNFNWYDSRSKQMPFREMMELEGWGYIKERYSLKHAAFAETKGGLVPVYYLLRIGGSFDERFDQNNWQNLDAILGRMQVKIKNYEYTFGKYRIGYINLD